MLGAYDVEKYLHWGVEENMRCNCGGEIRTEEDRCCWCLG